MKYNSSHIIIFNKNNEALVVKRSSSDEWEPNKWALPGGRRKNGESLLNNIRRETAEEVSINLVPKNIVFLPDLSKKLNHCFFTAKVSNVKPSLGDREHSEFKWIRPDQLTETDCIPHLQLQISEAFKKMSKCIKIKINKSDVQEDLLPGGIGDNTDSSSHDPKQILMGLKVEMEHTHDPKIALEIALDHLTEDPRYYSKLQKIEKK